MVYYGHMGGFGFFGMTLFWILFIGLIFWLIWQNQNKKNSAYEIAEERYARGDISRKEFEEIRKGLR